MHFVCPPKFCINCCFQILLGGVHIPQTIEYAKFGGQTKCIMGNWKIENKARTKLKNIRLTDICDLESENHQ